MIYIPTKTELVAWAWFVGRHLSSTLNILLMGQHYEPFCSRVHRRVVEEGSNNPELWLWLRRNLDGIFGAGHCRECFIYLNESTSGDKS